ncbi:MAG: hypothetical protein KC425_09475 [Anaerolineales bacterium]|nr:hypothetical protein [Anaerolineales bacterium]
MINYHKLIIDHFVKELKRAYLETYNILEPHIGNTLEWLGLLALENISNTDALYHNVDHTIMVTSVGQSILKGKHLCEGGVTPRDWLHYTMALLFHDIGYVRGICRADRNGRYATGVGGETVGLPPGGTDASLTPYHVDRSQLFVRERFGEAVFTSIDVELVNGYIEMTRYPVPAADPFYADTAGYRGLVRAADFIGQLGDPNYLRKLPALFYEFEETGMNQKLGYRNHGDMRRGYAGFYWQEVRPFIQDALHYLRITHAGKQWIAQLHSHVFDVEHAADA